MAVIRAATTIMARFFLTAGFLAVGAYKIFYWHESEQLLMEVLSNWQFHLSSSESAQQLLSTLIEFTPLTLFIMCALEIVGGLLLLLGIRERLGAFLLILLLIPTTLLFHQFWFVDASQKELHLLLFFKNLGILGGLLLVLLFGAKTERKKDETFRF